MNEILKYIPPDLMNDILALIGAVIGFYLTMLLREVKRKTGVDIRLSEENEIELLRSRLDDVIYNAVGVALSKFPDGSIESRTNEAIGYAMEANPDLMRKLNVDPLILQDRIRSKISRATLPADSTI